MVVPQSAQLGRPTCATCCFAQKVAAPLAAAGLLSFISHLGRKQQTHISNRTYPAGHVCSVMPADKAPASLEIFCENDGHCHKMAWSLGGVENATVSRKEHQCM